jgi:hypothetical protein
VALAQISWLPTSSLRRSALSGGGDGHRLGAAVLLREGVVVRMRAMDNSCSDRSALACHLEAVLTVYVEHHNAHRPHWSLSQRPPTDCDATLPTIGDVNAARLRKADRLGGLIHECRMVA